MDRDNDPKQRKHPRIALSPNDGVYCIVMQSKFAGKTLALPAKDFSESGFRFSVAPQMKDDFYVGGKLFLKAIAGSRNLTFKEPAELRIRWQKEEKHINLVDIGCEIFNMTTRAKKQFIEFIKAEEKFRGLNGRPRSPIWSRSSAGGHEAAPAEKHPTRHTLDIVSIFGGPRHNGNTARITGWVEAALTDQGHRVKRIDLFSKTVNGCRGCLQCKENLTEPGCVQKDDAEKILHEMVAGDIVIYSSPLYNWGFSAQMKALLDRCHCLFRGICGQPEHASFVEGRRQALIITTDGPFSNNADQILTTFHRMLLANKARSAGELFLCNTAAPDALGDDIRNQAVKFANQISGPFKTPYAVLIPGSM